MNYFLTARGIISLNCSANAGNKGDVALFFGLPGTGKTTLSTDPQRALLGDDEHGWDDEGIFCLEGGCYPICHNLNRDNEPEIYKAIRRDALIENLVIKSDGSIDFNDETRTENARVSYPVHHIDNIVNAESKAGHPANVILLSKDTFGVLPPVSRLTEEQFKYYFLSGYSARVALTDSGLVEPVPLFSACFCAPYLMTDPVKNTEELAGKMRTHGTTSWLVNTGWIYGSYGKGYRIDLPTTRTIINAIFDGSINEGGFNLLSVFNLSVPYRIRGISDEILDPANSWESRTKWHIAASDLALKFINNFSKFSSNPEISRLSASGPGII
jgi:phosphoenolpyruvate carboxykinase (ATP)